MEPQTYFTMIKQLYEINDNILHYTDNITVLIIQIHKVFTGFGTSVQEEECLFCNWLTYGFGPRIRLLYQQIQRKLSRSIELHNYRQNPSSP